MSDTARTILIALGVALLVVIVVPTLFMGTMMSGGIMGGMGAGAWVMLGLVLAILLAGGALLFTALRR